MLLGHAELRFIITHRMKQPTFVILHLLSFSFHVPPLLGRVATSFSMTLCLGSKRSLPRADAFSFGDAHCPIVAPLSRQYVCQLIILFPANTQRWLRFTGQRAVLINKLKSGELSFVLTGVEWVKMVCDEAGGRGRALASSAASRRCSLVALPAFLLSSDLISLMWRLCLFSNWPLHRKRK